MSTAGNEIHRSELWNYSEHINAPAIRWHFTEIILKSPPQQERNFPVALETNVAMVEKSQHYVSPSNGRGKPRNITRLSYSSLPCMAEIKHAVTQITTYPQSEVSGAWRSEKAGISKTAQTAWRLRVLSLGSGNEKDTGRIITLRYLNSSGNAERENKTYALCAIRNLQPG